MSKARSVCRSVAAIMRVERIELPAIVLIVVVVATLALCPRSEARAAWLQFQGDAGHTGYVPGAYQPTTFGQRWSITAPPYSGASGDRAVAIDGGRVYATILDGYSFSGPYNVVALDLASGAEQWKRVLAGNSHSGVSAPSVMNGRVYVHKFGHSGSSGSTYPDDYPQLVGLDAANGAPLFATTHSGQWSSGSRPTPIGGQVFAAGGYYGGMDAYNATSGANTWYAAIPQQYDWTPAADASRVYVYMGYASASPGPSPGRLFALNRVTGAKEFEILHPQSTSTYYGELQNVVIGGHDDAMAMTPGSIAPGTGSILVNFDLVDRDIRWQLGGNWSGNLAVHDGLLAVPEGAKLSFLDQATGQRLWSWSSPAGSLRQAILTDNLAFVSSSSATYAIDLSTRQSVWSVPIGGELALSDYTLVVSNTSGVTAIAVPEPASLLTGGAALVLFAINRRRRGIE